MNKYGQQAQTYWETERPEALSQIPDPAAFFQDLGEQIQQRVTDLSLDLAGSDPAGEEYLAKVGRLNAARNQAEEMAMAELVYSQEPEQTDENLDEPSRADQMIHQAWADLNADET